MKIAENDRISCGLYVDHIINATELKLFIWMKPVKSRAYLNKLSGIIRYQRKHCKLLSNKSKRF